MSMTETAAPDSGQTTDVLIRQFHAELTPGDGRTVDMRIVPYGEVISHNDGGGDVPRGQIYREEFAAGAFNHQLRAANRVLVNVEHQEGIGGIVGHGKALLEQRDGLYGSVKIHETPDGDKALLLVREGVLDGVSLEFRADRNEKTAAGVIRRTKAHLINIALTRFNAYSGAGVLGVRDEAQFTIDVDMLPTEISDDTLKLCRSLGIALPDRLQAHLAGLDTSPDGDTSSSDTRHSNNDNNTEEG
jgi:HK97 family phage prohead protease